LGKQGKLRNKENTAERPALTIFEVDIQTGTLLVKIMAIEESNRKGLAQRNIGLVLTHTHPPINCPSAGIP
jgi:hypothetical protein